MFESKHGPFIKVGHYAGTNAYSRVAHRGFYSCVCPREIQTRVSLEDLILVAWHPGLTKKEERFIKTKWKAFRIFKSEWFPLEKKEEILAYLSALDADQKETCCMETAQKTRRRL